MKTRARRAVSIVSRACFFHAHRRCARLFRTTRDNLPWRVALGSRRDPPPWHSVPLAFARSPRSHRRAAKHRLQSSAAADGADERLDNGSREARMSPGWWWPRVAARSSSVLNSSVCREDSEELGVFMSVCRRVARGVVVGGCVVVVAAFRKRPCSPIFCNPRHGEVEVKHSKRSSLSR